MQEAKKSIKERGIKAKDVKNLPPIKKVCEPTTHPPMVEVHPLLDFNASDIPKGKPPDQCLDEFDNFIMKQNHFNEKIQGQLNDNALAIKSLLDVLSRTVKCLVKHFHMVQTQLEQISNVQKDLLANNAKQDNLQAYGIKTRGGTHTQDPLYAESIQRGPSKILKYGKKKLLAPQRRRRRKTDTRKLTIPMILWKKKNQRLTQTTYPPPMLRLKTVLNLKNMLRRMIHPKFVKKKHPISARSIQEKN